MNVWAEDPWQDDDTFTPKQEAGNARAAPAQPAVLNAFEDDAGWGDFEASEDNVWGNDPWSRSSQPQDLPSSASATALAASAEEPVIAGDSILANEHAFVTSDNSTEEKDPSWEAPATDATHPKSPIRTPVVLSEPGFVRDILGEERELTEGTLPDKDILVSHDAEEEPKITHTRPVSSSSEATSHTETASVFSDRISLEQGLPDEQIHKANVTETDIASQDIIASAHERELDQAPNEQDNAGLKTAVARQAPRGERATVPSGPDFTIDLDLLNQLFKPREKEQKKVEQASEDLIDSTASRKMWYRLSRPQTLRGFLSGDMEDSHVRVAWSSSRVRQETVKIVARWTTEDRSYGKSGFGGPSRTTFGWDEPRSSVQHDSSNKSPVIARLPHSRQPSMLAAGTTSSPVASFGWSTSPTSSAFPAASTQTVHDMLSPVRTSVENPWRRSSQSRPSSLQITSASIDAAFAKEPASKRNSLYSSQMLPTQTPSAQASRTTLVIDTTLASTGLSLDADDDDEWGEMVQSPPATSAQSTFQTALSIRSEQPQKVSPISPISSKQIVPEGPLSPSRRAAFSAARVTRTLSSQHETTIGLDQTTQFSPAHEDFTKVKLRKLSQSGQAGSVETPIPSGPEGFDTLTTPSDLEAPSLTQDMGSDDFSLFESTYGHGKDSKNPADSTLAKPALSDQNAHKVRAFLAQLPDLSYMSR